MAFSGPVPPTHTVEPIDPAPLSAPPTTAELKADIDSGQTGDKTEVFDPGLSPLGTDDEAAGTPAGPIRIEIARRFETVRGWAKGSRQSGYAHQHADYSLYGFLGLVSLIGLVMVVGVAWAR